LSLPEAFPYFQNGKLVDIAVTNAPASFPQKFFPRRAAPRLSGDRMKCQGAVPFGPRLHGLRVVGQVKNPAKHPAGLPAVAFQLWIE